MNAKKIALLAAGIVLIAIAASKQAALDPSWQLALVQYTVSAILAVAFAAFVSEEQESPIILWITTVACWDGVLLVSPPMPSFLIGMYTLLAFLSVVLYLSVSGAQLNNLIDSFKDLLDSPTLKNYRMVLLVLIPFWTGAVVLAKTASERPAPVFPRSVHPAPPDSSDFKGKGYEMAKLENPYRHLEKDNPEEFALAVKAGKDIYYRNCFFCHGDHLSGKGPLAPALNPLPANFQDPGTIAMLQESFVFWRISKGGPGMPGSGHPWNTAMPAWEDMLSEDEIWKVILWIYSYTDQSPRTWAEEEEGGH